MNNSIGILLLTFLLQVNIKAQNLLPNGSFESLDISGCLPPQESFVRTQNWYTIQGSPDLFAGTCPIPAISEVFWNENPSSFDGSNFIGLKCRVNSNKSYLSEGIASQLENKLVEGESYYIAMKVRNKGIYQGFPASVIDCPLKPEKQIEIYTHSDSIIVTNDFSNGSASSNANLVAAVNSIALKSDKLSTDWVEVGTCFVADSEVSHLSINMPLGNFGEFPPCSANDTRGTFFSYYFDIDNILLQKLPVDTTIIRSIEKGSKYEIYVPEELDLPFLAEATILWEDGSKESRRVFDMAGKYPFQIVLDCGMINAVLDLQEKTQEFPFFIPNVFSPNEDGLNDYLEIFIPEGKTVSKFSFTVFDRWGNIVFSTADVKDFWDGRIGNRNVYGSYLYHLSCSIQDESGSQDYVKTDLVSITR